MKQCFHVFFFNKMVKVHSIDTRTLPGMKQTHFTLSALEQVPYATKKYPRGRGWATIYITSKMAAVEDRTNSNPLVQPLLTDLYQITMAYAYWKSGKVLDNAVFDLYFRRNPFHGEFTVFAGLEECVHFVRNFRFSESGEEYCYIDQQEIRGNIIMLGSYIVSLSQISLKSELVASAT